MLALIFRGVFFVGVVGWYSTSLWRMIDGYFKDQFQRYLDEEYQRNPKMREDVRIHAPVDKLANPLTGESKEVELQRLLESCGLGGVDACRAAGEADSTWREHESQPALAAMSENGLGAGAAAEETMGKEVAGPRDSDGGAFLEHRDAEPPDEMPKNQTDGIKNNDEEKALIIEETKRVENSLIVESKKEEQPPMQEKIQIRKKRKSGKRPRIGAKSEEAAKRKAKRVEIPTLTLTDDDFDSVMRKRRFTNNENERSANSDFSEFDDEDNRALNENYEDEEEDAGILTADLPFKPLIDVYDLERLSREEFCPLTLEDDPSCEDTRSWP